MLDLKKYCVTVTNGNVCEDVGIETYAFIEEDVVKKLRAVIRSEDVDFVEIYEMEGD